MLTSELRMRWKANFRSKMLLMEWKIFKENMSQNVAGWKMEGNFEMEWKKFPG